MKEQVSAILCKAIIIYRILFHPPKKISLLGYGGSGICGISGSIGRCFTPIYSYLADIDRQAEELFFRLVEQMAEREGITETLKADNQMEWVQRMNALRAAVTETVNAEVIFV